MTKRVKGFIVPGSHVAMLATNGSVVVDVMDGAPKTAKFENAVFDYARRAFVVVVSDDTFDIIPEGSEIPIQFTTSIVTVFNYTEVI